MLTEDDREWLAGVHPGLRPSDHCVSGTISFVADYSPEINRFFILDRPVAHESSSSVISGQFDITIQKRDRILNSELPAVHIEGVETAKDRHFDQSDGSACLCSPFDEDEFLRPKFDFRAFLERLVIPFLYGQAFYTRNQRWPWAECEHGTMGIIESYPSCSARESAEKCLRLLRGNSLVWIRIRKALKQRAHLNGNMQCFCGRGIRIKNCHPRALSGAIRLREDLKIFGMRIR